jgi:Mn-dependent DtxR family transcriptional regulator
VNSLKGEISRRLGKDISWNTTRKYLRELIEMGLVRAIPTQHSKLKGKEGLTVYTLKR